MLTAAGDCEQVQEERNSFLEEAADKGYVSGYTGWRRSLKGTRFQARQHIMLNAIPIHELVVVYYRWSLQPLHYICTDICWPASPACTC